MQELGHERLTLLKVDVEGSEWLFLEEMLDTMGCPPIDQITIEFHHFTFESRYGAMPEIAVVTNLLRACGWKIYERLQEWTSYDKKLRRNMTYGMIGYCRLCGEEESWQGPLTSWVLEK